MAGFFCQPSPAAFRASSIDSAELLRLDKGRVSCVIEYRRLVGFTLPGRPSLKKLREELRVSETACTACSGTGFAPVKQSNNPMKRAFPARCGKCDGRGKPSRTTQKRLGRPPTTGRGLQVGERWQQPELAAIDAWIEATGESITRGEAIRRLVELGLKAKK
jgi:hypothetical protein